jgi:MFS family permease
MPESEKNAAKSSLSSDRIKGKLFYGWVVAIAGCLIIFSGSNLSYVYGVSLKPIINKFHWSRAATAGGTSARSITSAILHPVAGILSDRYGARKSLMVGIILVGLSWILLSRITDLWQLYALLGISMAIGMSAVYTPIVAAVSKWFGGRAALPIGIVLSGYGLAQVLLPPLVTHIILQYGWETAFVIVGLLTWSLGTLAWSFVRNPPQRNLNQSLQESGRVAATNEASQIQVPTPDAYTLSEALRTPTFWIIFLVYVVAAMWYQMIMIHIVAAATDVGFSPGSAALILTLSGITNILGRLTLGAIAGRLGNKTILVIAMATQVPTLFILAGARDLAVFYTATMVHSIAYGGTTPIILTLVGSLFGTRSAGAIIGTLTVAYTVGTAIGPFLAGYLFDITGSYYAVFIVAGITMAAASLLSLLIKPPRRKALTQ